MVCVPPPPPPRTLFPRKNCPRAHVLRKWSLRRRAAVFQQKNGVLYYTGSGSGQWQRVVRLVEERKRILDACHSSVEGNMIPCSTYFMVFLNQGGHLARDKTYEKVASRFYWSSVNEDVRLHIQFCDVCQRTNDVKFVKHSATLHPIPVKLKVWNQVIFCWFVYVVLTRLPAGWHRSSRTTPKDCQRKSIHSHACGLLLKVARSRSSARQDKKNKQIWQYRNSNQ